MSLMRNVALMLAFTGVAASCAATPQSLLTTSGKLREQTPFTPVPVSQSWINAPGVLMVMQRGLRGESEQRVALVNRAGTPGENILILRTQSRAGRAGRLDYDEFVRWAGGTPAPFGALQSGDLLSGDDDTGTYFWAEERLAGGTLCVLGLRRLTSAQRLLPAGASTLDILLRNCVRDDLEEALIPLKTDSVSTAPVAGASVGASRVISPLAAPVVR